MRPDRPFDFRTIAILYTLLGLVVALIIHFVVLSSPEYNWLSLLGSN
ncbi:MAG: light-harvesting protein [Roseiflexaceae bacterium]|nr:light-harvesting protein [Roseiflexaceae bacterium]